MVMKHMVVQGEKVDQMERQLMMEILDKVERALDQMVEKEVLLEQQ